MGFLDNIFMAADLVKGGIAAYKASEHLEELAQQAIDFYEEQFTDESKKLYADYKKLKEKYDATSNAEESNKILEDVEKALVAFLLSLATNPTISKKFKQEITDGIAEYNRTNDLPEEYFEKYMMKMAKTPEEKAEVKRVLAEIAAQEEAEKKAENK